MNNVLRLAAEAHLLIERRLDVLRGAETDRGQSSAEYAGIIFVAVALVGVLIGAAATWGDEITTLVSEKIAEIGG